MAQGVVLAFDRHADDAESRYEVEAKFIEGGTWEKYKDGEDVKLELTTAGQKEQNTQERDHFRRAWISRLEKMMNDRVVAHASATEYEPASPPIITITGNWLEVMRPGTITITATFVIRAR